MIDKVERLFEYKGFEYRSIEGWKKLGKATFWCIDHYYKTPEFKIDWLRAPFDLRTLSEEEFRFWVDMSAPDPHHLKVVCFTGSYIRRLMGVHEQLGIPLGEWEQLRLGLKILAS